jgi:hypothetical protein
VPASFKGKFKIEVLPVLGPFKWEAEEPAWQTVD